MIIILFVSSFFDEIAVVRPGSPVIVSHWRKRCELRLSQCLDTIPEADHDIRFAAGPTTVKVLQRAWAVYTENHEDDDEEWEEIGE
jgi:hypothetical protein